MEWQPATIEEVRQIIETDLADCDAEQREVFTRFSIEPYLVPIYRKWES